jgi:hypothetical protein
MTVNSTAINMAHNGGVSTGLTIADQAELERLARL